jgi:hypothetical protein
MSSIIYRTVAPDKPKGHLSRAGDIPWIDFQPEGEPDYEEALGRLPALNIGDLIAVELDAHTRSARGRVGGLDTHDLACAAPLLIRFAGEHLGHGEKNLNYCAHR